MFLSSLRVDKGFSEPTSEEKVGTEWPLGGVGVLLLLATHFTDSIELCKITDMLHVTH